MDWLIDNREWLFSGILVALPVAIIGWLLGRRVFRKVQQQKGGHGCLNIRAGQNINLDAGHPNDKAETNGGR